MCGAIVSHDGGIEAGRNPDAGIRAGAKDWAGSDWTVAA